MKFFLTVAILIPFLCAAGEDRKPKTNNLTPANAKVFFVNLKDGQVISTKYKVQMGIEGMKLRNASDDINDKTSGHHHILVNHKSITKNEAIPADDTHIHFGKSQTEAELNLKPGKYLLTLQLADGAHRSYGPELSSSVNIEVK